jgi:hypothetical protein
MKLSQRLMGIQLFGGRYADLSGKIVCGRDAAVERTEMYSQRVLPERSAYPRALTVIFQLHFHPGMAEFHT